MFDYLRDKLGHHVTFEMIESKVQLKDSGHQWRFDNILLMAPSVKGKQQTPNLLWIENTLDTSVKVDSLVEFFEAEGHNLVAFGDLDSRRHFRSLALSFGIDFEPFVSSNTSHIFLAPRTFGLRNTNSNYWRTNYIYIL